MTRRLPLLALALGAALASTHCQRDTAAGSAAASCCELTPNAQLPDGVGRIVVAYPGDGGASSTRIDVHAAGDTGTALESRYGDAQIERAPGAYDVTIGGRRILGVRVQAQYDTRIRVGVLHVHASTGTRIELVDETGGAPLASGYGEAQYGLPVGAVLVRVAGQHEAASIEDGRITEF